MKLLDKILVPVTLEAHRNTHLETAALLARTFKSQLIVIHVLHEEAKRASVNQYVSKYVDQDLDILLKDLKVDKGTIKRVVEYGNTFDRIISTAEEENVNLILFSNFIEQQNGKYSMDIVAEKLVRKSEKPVWIVREGEKAFPDAMLCTVDYSDASRRALNNAIKIARTFKKRLYILNVFKPLENNFSPRHSIDFNEENERLAQENKRQFDEFLATFNFTDVDYEVSIGNGEPETEILSFVSGKKIDLLFMGATGKNFLQRVLLGSVTEKLIRELPSSMVVTKAENILNLKIDSDITEMEHHLSNASLLEASGYYEEAIGQLKHCIRKNDLHIPALHAIARLYDKIGDAEKAQNYRQKIELILRRLWDKKIEFEIRKQLKF